MATDSEMVTQAEGASRLGITPQAIGVWATKTGAPVRTRAGKRLLLWPEFPRWREAQLLTTRSEAPAVAKSRARKLAAEARMVELDLQEREGQVVPIAETRRVVAKLLTRLRGQLMVFPQRVAPQAVGLKTLAETEQVLSRGIRDMLTLLSGDLPIEEESP
ncbi:MAG: hypothetical protein ACYC2K_18735 [Gemmatimonadales bacterium]